MGMRRALAGICFAAWACGGAARGPARAPTPATVPAGSGAIVALNAPPSEEDAAVPISPTDPARGSREALVTIVEFADFECPYCVRAEATLAEVVAMYGPDTVRIVWKNNPLPFHPNAAQAAEAAAGVFALAGAESFWKFHDSALHASNALGPQAYEQWAKDAGVVDLAAFRAGLANHQWASAVGKDLDDGKSLGVMGTPTFFVNGHPLAGALPFPTFRGAVDEQVRLAQSKIAAGTPRDRVYVELTRDNRARESDSGDEPEQAPPKTVYKVPIGSSPVRGSPGALVTLVEFADYECPFCVRAEATLKALRDEYGDKLRVVFKDAPLAFHPRAEPAAEAALEVRAERGDTAFWAMHDELLGGSAYDLGDDALVQRATRLGARADAVRAAIASHAHRKHIEEDADLAEDFEANGTPHFFINGRRLAGAQPKEKFEEIIDEEVKRAQGVMAGGARPEALYDALLRDGQGPPEPEKKALPANLPGHDPTRGNASARVTVHEWSDFQCPFCKRAQPVLEQVVRDYGGRVKIVWHDLPLSMHPDAALAARASREALAQKGERAFWALHDVLFAHQQELKREDLDGYARSAGLDMSKWKAALDGAGHQEQIDAEAEVATGMDITGTPAFLVVAAGARKGYFIGGAQGYSKFRRVIDRALREAK